MPRIITDKRQRIGRRMKLTERWKEERRARLLPLLLIEIEQDGDGITKLYASLLARELVQRGDNLHAQFSERVFEATSEPADL